MDNAGLDLQRGRPLPAIGTTEAKLQQRKLDALKRGIHRIPQDSRHAHGVHLIGVGREGTRVIEAALRSAPADLLDPDGSRLTVLAVDIGDDALEGVGLQADSFPADKAQIETLALGKPSSDDLRESVSRYQDFLKLEYPLYHPNPDSGEWLPQDDALERADVPIARATAKAIYGRAYYDGTRPAFRALKRFAASVESTGADSIVCIVFSLSESVGSGIALDLARHLSSGLFGRRVLVAGIGIAPHPDGDPQDLGAALSTVFSELDVLCDETKNKGITLSCGDLFKNPFTAGFIMVPQLGRQAGNGARELLREQLASLFVQRRGANLWEALRLLNWVAAPSTQHSAARTPWGSRWIHMFGFGGDDGAPRTNDLRAELGLLADYQPEFLELRTGEEADDGVAQVWADMLDAAFSPEVPTHRVDGGKPGTVQFLLPRVALTDLVAFDAARDAYDAEPIAKRHAHHSLLLDQGLLLCEPSTVIEGMAGRSLGRGGQWIAVPMHQLRGDRE